MSRSIFAPLTQTLRGIAAARRSAPRLFWGAAAAVAAFSFAAPVAILSLARKLPDSFSFNPWLRRLPEFLASDAPLEKKLSFVSGMAIAWVSADSPGAGVEWSFVADVPTLVRVAVTSLIVALYVVLWRYRLREGSALLAPAGAAGALSSALAIGTGPCTLAGCGAPVLPVVGLAFTGLSSGAIALLSAISRTGAVLALAAIGAVVLWLGWRAGAGSAAGKERT